MGNWVSKTEDREMGNFEKMGKNKDNHATHISLPRFSEWGGGSHHPLPIRLEARQNSKGGKKEKQVVDEGRGSRAKPHAPRKANCRLNFTFPRRGREKNYSNRSVDTV